jgi:ABC-type bacteriocin/lantibiotic exporter with double-glycine peptidase domain
MAQFSSRQSFHNYKKFKGKGTEPLHDRRRFARGEQPHQTKTTVTPSDVIGKPSLLLGEVKRRETQLVSLFLFSVLIIGLDLLIPYLLKRLFETAINGDSESTMVGGGFPVLFLVILAGTMQFTKAIKQERLKQNVSNGIRIKFLKHIFNVSYPEFRRFRIGALTSHLFADIDATSGIIFNMILKPVLSSVKIIGTLAVLFYFSWHIASIITVALSVLAFTYVALSQNTRSIHDAIAVDRHRSYSRVNEMFRGIRFIKEFRQERKTILNFVLSQNLIARKSLFLRRIQTLLDTGWDSVYGAINVTIVWAGCVLVTKKQISIADVVLCQLYVNNLFPPVWELISAYSGGQSQLVSQANLQMIMNTKPEGAVRQTGVQIDKTSVSLEFKNVCFKYQGAIKGVDNINMRIEPGQFVALIGSSGSGKSTILDLISRFIEPSRGQIELNGIDVRAIALSHFREIVIGVNQHPFLFAGTISDNIALGLFPDPEAIERIGRLVEIHEFVSQLPNGYNTYLNESGSGLSTGQIQRIALARILYADPKILLLDEATSNLDSKTEMRVLSNIRAAYSDKIIISSTHRLETIQDSDTVIMISDGKIHSISDGRQFALGSAS